MRFHAVSGAAARRRTDCAIVGIHENGALAASAAPLDARLDGRLARLAKRGDLRGRIGETTLLDVDGGPCQRVLVVGIGSKGALTRKQYKKAMLAAAAALVRRRRARRRKLPVARNRERDRCVLSSRASRRRRWVTRSTACPRSAARASRRSRAALAAFAIAVQNRSQVADAKRGLCARRGYRRGRLAHARPRQPARQRLHAHAISPQQRAAARARAYDPSAPAGARRTRAEAPADGLVPLGHGRHRRAGASSSCCAISGGRRGAGAGRAGRQGHHLRHRRHLAQAAAGHGRDEVRHDRRGERVRRDQGRRRSSDCRSTSSASCPPARTCRAAARPSRATSCAACPARPSRSSTPTPRAA